MPPIMAPLPTYAPMLAQLGSLPSVQGDEWAVEMKWDGVRALAYVQDGAVRLKSRNAKDVTAAYPELQLMAGAVGGRAAVVDGEVVAFDEAGRPSFEALQPRMHQRRPERIAELIRSVPVTFMAFDVLHIERHSTVALPYTERRRLLEGLLTPGHRWQVPVWFHDHAGRALESSLRLGLEGLVCKRLSSPYRPGRRSSDWTKIKNVRAVEVVIGGWRPGAGRRAGMIGSLLLGAYDAGRLLFVGHVGTGFSQATLAALGELLRPLERPDPPFDVPLPREDARDARWVEPCLVGEVQYAELTADLRLRHPSWRGLRPDREPAEVTVDLLRAHDHPGESAAG
jgi:bifunctional non-homologous end joining protein LigD